VFFYCMLLRYLAKHEHPCLVLRLEPRFFWPPQLGGVMALFRNHDCIGYWLLVSQQCGHELKRHLHIFELQVSGATGFFRCLCV